MVAVTKVELIFLSRSDLIGAIRDRRRSAVVHLSVTRLTDSMEQQAYSFITPRHSFVTFLSPLASKKKKKSH